MFRKSSRPKRCSNHYVMDTSLEGVLAWTCGDVGQYVETVTGSAELAQKFKDQFITGEALLELSQDDLKTDLSMPLGHRKIIWKFINETKLQSVVVVEDISVIKSIESNDQPDDHTFKSPSQATPLVTEKYSASSSKAPTDQFTGYTTVKNTLLNHPQGEELHHILQKGPICENDRRALIRITVSELTKIQSFYPGDESKEALAKAIVTEYPLLKDNNVHALGYEHFFHPSTRKGFIQYRLWTVQKKLADDLKKYSGVVVKKRRRTTSNNALDESHNEISQEDLDEKIAWMKYKIPNDTNKTGILECLAETFGSRKMWISKTGPTISSIFEMYPRLLDYKGEMIDHEFEMRFPGCGDNFSSRFALTYTDKILGYANKYRVDLMKKITKIAEDDNLKALLILAALLPVSNGAKGRGKKKGKPNPQRNASSNCDSHDLQEVGQIPNPELVVILPENSSLPLSEKEFRETTKKAIQPYLMWIKGQDKATCFVQGDGWFIMPRDNMKYPSRGI